MKHLMLLLVMVIVPFNVNAWEVVDSSRERVRLDYPEAGKAFVETIDLTAVRIDELLWSENLWVEALARNLISIDESNASDQIWINWLEVYFFNPQLMGDPYILPPGEIVFFENRRVYSVGGGFSFSM